MTQNEIEKNIKDLENGVLFERNTLSAFGEPADRDASLVFWKMKLLEARLSSGEINVHEFEREAVSLQCPDI